MVYFPCKRLMAHILLLGHVLSGCGNVRYLRMGVWRSSDGSSGSSSKLCRVGCTSRRPIALPSGSVLDFYESGSCCWALLRSGSNQVLRLPVKFSDGFTSALLAGSDPSWQARYIHLHSSSGASLTPGFVYIGPSVEASPSQSKASVASCSLSADVAIGGSPCLASSSFRYTLFKAPGYKIVLSPDGARWQAMVHDDRFPGLRGSYVAEVVFGKGYVLEDFIRKDAAYQSYHIHLLANKDRPMVYIGSAGLQGGGCNCNEPVWYCVFCLDECPNNCCKACCTHKNDPKHRTCRTIGQQQLQQEREDRDKFRDQQEEIEALKIKRKRLESDLMREESSLKVYVQKKRAERTARSLALTEALAAKKQAIHNQSFLDETNGLYNKFISNV